MFKQIFISTQAKLTGSRSFLFAQHSSAARWSLRLSPMLVSELLLGGTDEQSDYECLASATNLQQIR